MPSYFSTKEAMVLVLKGEAVLELTMKAVHLKANDSTIIPAMNSIFYK